MTDHSQCWGWVGAINNHGYGYFYANTDNIAAHRYSFEYFIGVIPHNGVVHHMCENRLCTNPLHLELTNNSDHAAFHLTREESCNRGHLRTEESTYIRPNGDRECRECRKLYVANWRRKHVY